MDRFTSFRAPADEEKGFFSRLISRFSSAVPPASPPAKLTTASPSSVDSARVSSSPLSSSVSGIGSVDSLPVVTVDVLPGVARSSSPIGAPSPSSTNPLPSTSPNGNIGAEYSMHKNFRMKDESAMVCYQCDSPFSVLNRRKHCFACGQIFCGKCTRRTESSGLKLPKATTKQIVRVCEFCFQTLRVEAPSQPSRGKDDGANASNVTLTRNGRSSTNLASNASTTSTLSILDASHLDLDELSDEDTQDGTFEEEEELLSKTYKRISIRNLKHLMRASMTDLEDVAATNTANNSSNTTKDSRGSNHSTTMSQTGTFQGERSNAQDHVSNAFPNRTCQARDCKCVPNGEWTLFGMHFREQKMSLMKMIGMMSMKL